MPLDINHAEQKAYLTYCPVCQGPSEELVVGEVCKYFSEDGNLIGYGHPGGYLAQDLIAKGVTYTTEVMDDAERAPAGTPCANCKAELAHQRKVLEQEVINGGIHWACVACGQFGVIVANDSKGFAAGVRANAGVYPPQQLGVRFTHCNQHASEEDCITGIH